MARERVKPHLIGHFPTVQFNSGLPLSRWIKKGIIWPESREQQAICQPKKSSGD
ncbi:MAG TPA: hypothetical protein VFV38_21325 [Ktedonobacteraceae bacterium]|nr:hypothetical protein [Ktedonobacteraceae bacterium]